MIEITIDGQIVKVQPGYTVLQAALDNGIEIPHLCYHPELSISGGCRLCIVELEGNQNKLPSCGLECQEGMVIQTQSAELYAKRREIIDLFLSEHPLPFAAHGGSAQLMKGDSVLLHISTRQLHNGMIEELDERD